MHTISFRHNHSKVGSEVNQKHLTCKDADTLHVGLSRMNNQTNIKVSSKHVHVLSLFILIFSQLLTKIKENYTGYF